MLIHCVLLRTKKADAWETTRGTIKTYSRQQAWAERDGSMGERPRKRTRMSESGVIVEERVGVDEVEQASQEIDKGKALQPLPASESVSDPLKDAVVKVPALSSSTSAPSSPPNTDRVFSSDPLQDDESELSSAPSSPPPFPSPKPPTRKPAFAFLKRKRSTVDDGSGSEPLSDITPNARKVPRLGKKVLTQMQIDLGGEVRKTCRTCGMEFVPSVKEDSALHSKFCAMNVGGVEMGKPFLKDDSVKRIYSHRTRGSEWDMVVTVDRQSSLAAKHRARRVLDVVNEELSSADISDDQLWSTLYPAEKIVRTRKSSIDSVDMRGHRFKAFLYMIGDRCVGFCLAEKIKNAFQVVSTTAEESQGRAKNVSSSISVSTVADLALLGIARIWTSKSHRSQGIAADLLDCARLNFFHGVEAPKNLIAFSQPTESGGQLAEHFFKAKAGWHVYRGEQ